MDCLTPLRWPRLNLANLIEQVQPDRVDWARAEATKHEAPIYPGLPYTESQYEWVLLYEHIQRGQIHPNTLKRMRRVDLEYLAGHPMPHPGLVDPTGLSDDQLEHARGRAMKIVENVARATRELDRRSNWRNVFWTSAIATAIATTITAWIVA